MKDGSTFLQVELDCPVDDGCGWHGEDDVVIFADVGEWTCPNCGMVHQSMALFERLVEPEEEDA